MKRSRIEKSPWLKIKTKPEPNKKKIDQFHPDRYSINSQKAKQLVLHLWMYQQSLRIKIMRAKKAKESNVTIERLSSLKPRCGTCT